MDLESINLDNPATTLIDVCWDVSGVDIGTWHYPTNIQGRLRHIRRRDEYADLDALRDVSPHSFRRTVATEIDEVYDAEAAMDQLGHTSRTVTERHYISRKRIVPDHRETTERLAHGSGTNDGPAPGL